jgi:hypothetical protein
VTPPPPSPSFQLRFLQYIQRVLSDGTFVATYKFALLHALADLCVEKGGAEAGAALTLRTEDLARRFVDLYERQARPFPAGRKSRVLQQNTGRQARVVTVVAEAVARYGGERLVRVDDRRTLREVDSVIRRMPLWKLQTIAGERTEFLYPNVEDYDAREITLHPGIAYCFRECYGLVVSLVRDRWETAVRRWNPGVFEEGADLHDFLFGTPRARLAEVRPVLWDLQEGRCFYTGRPLAGDVHVDHFVPWSLFPTDLAHNFVLASRAANAAKSDHLAAEEHLERWLRRSVEHRDALAERFDARRLPHSLEGSLRIAEWGYASAAAMQAPVWVRGREMRPLAPGWRGLFEGVRG